MAKFLEIRRHSLRRPPAPHLIQEGVSLARRIGQTTGPFDLVISSPAPRAIETAVAMGFAVDREEELISRLPDALDKILPFPQPFAAYQAARSRTAVAVHLGKLAQFYSELAESLADGAAALVVCHGGIVELSAVACVPEADYRAIGPHLECLEGVRLTWAEGSFVGVQVLRLSAHD